MKPDVLITRPSRESHLVQSALVSMDVVKRVSVCRAGTLMQLTRCGSLLVSSSDLAYNHTVVTTTITTTKCNNNERYNSSYHKLLTVP